MDSRRAFGAVVWTTVALPISPTLLENLQILAKANVAMKRKRGPAPHGKKSRLKLKETAIADPAEDSKREENGSDDEEDSFKGISEDDEERGQTPEPPRLEEPVNNVNGSSKKTKKKGKNSLPSKEELTELLFQSTSFQSNLFKLQVDELLSEVRIKYDKMEKVERVLHQLKDLFNRIPESQEQLVRLSARVGLMKVTCF